MTCMHLESVVITHQMYKRIYLIIVWILLNFFFVKLNFKISLEVFTHKANASICECFQWV